MNHFIDKRNRQNQDQNNKHYLFPGHSLIEM